ncbi:hypothetical protein MKW94_016800 [Papaver nudicaule]|uniref:Uncharacterized protein n=1 Tax=Papaver nudicaule TaxID=74823 RepID=A0AA41VN73_PAPNU|nr:hypothetical protein [Papaver nudicaule]
MKIVPKRPIKYSVVDAFTDRAFKGNPAAVCLLEAEDKKDDEWLLGVAREFNAPVTCYLTRVLHHNDDDCDESEYDKDYNLVFHIRWWCRVKFNQLVTIYLQVDICGHATMAAAQYLFASGLVKSNLIRFIGLSGSLTAKKCPARKREDISLDGLNILSNGGHYEEDNRCREPDDFFIELDFPTNTLVECDPSEIPSIPQTLNGASVLNIKKTASFGDLIILRCANNIIYIVAFQIEVSSGQNVIDLKPNFEELKGWKGGRGVVITGKAPHGSGLDFISRLFAPNLGVDEDAVCGSAHCALAPYWSKKLGKFDFLAYMASPRGGVLVLHLDKETQRLKIRGKAFIVMEGSLYA